MLEAVKVALDPTPRQERALLSHAGAARFAYNAALAHVKSQIEAGKRPDWSYYSLRRWWNAGKDGLAPWWRENSKEAYNAGLESLGRALKNYSASKAGERKGRRAGFPRFKTKDGAAPSYSYTTGSFGPIDGDPKALKLPRVGRVHCFEDVARRVGDAKVTRMTISRRAGRWYASLSVERPGGVPAPVRGRPSVGVDLGVKELATLSDGTVVPNPHAYKARLSGLKRAQRELSRKRKGSARRERAPQGGAGERAHSRLALGCDAQAHRRARADVRPGGDRGSERVRDDAQPPPRPGGRRRLLRRVPPAARIQGGAQRRPGGSGGVLLPKQQDVLAMRGSESQAAPVRSARTDARNAD